MDSRQEDPTALTAAEREALLQLRRAEPPPPHIERALLAGLAGPSPVTPWHRQAARWAAMAALLALAFFAGTRVKERRSPVPSPLFALFLIGEPPATATPRAAGQLEEEYRQWTDPLRLAGRVALAREIKGTPMIVGHDAEPRADVLVGITGMFLIQAADAAEARALAQTLPHVRDGGTVLVQRMDAP